MFKSVQHGIFSTHNRLEILSPCLDHSTLVSDLGGVKFMNPDTGLVEMANVRFRKDLPAGQACEVLINYAATIKHEEVTESAKLCFPDGPRGSHQRWGPRRPCPATFTSVR